MVHIGNGCNHSTSVHEPNDHTDWGDSFSRNFVALHISAIFLFARLASLPVWLFWFQPNTIWCTISTDCIAVISKRTWLQVTVENRIDTKKTMPSFVFTSHLFKIEQNNANIRDCLWDVKDDFTFLTFERVCEKIYSLTQYPTSKVKIYLSCKSSFILRIWSFFSLLALLMQLFVLLLLFSYHSWL